MTRLLNSVNRAASRTESRITSIFLYAQDLFLDIFQIPTLPHALKIRLWVTTRMVYPPSSFPAIDLLRDNARPFKRGGRNFALRLLTFDQLCDSAKDPHSNSSAGS